MNYKYKVGCNIANLKGVRDFIRQTLQHYAVSDIEVSEMVLAIDEMCSNLMIHAHHCNPEDLFEINVSIIHNDHVVFELVDDGTVFDINEFSEPTLDNIVQQKRKGGLGIRLVKSIMDKVEYHVSKERSVCRLTKKVHFK